LEGRKLTKTLPEIGQICDRIIVRK
jgi:hypothetical protein